MNTFKITVVPASSMSSKYMIENIMRSWCAENRCGIRIEAGVNIGVVNYIVRTDNAENTVINIMETVAKEFGYDRLCTANPALTVLGTVDNENGTYTGKCSLKCTADKASTSLFTVNAVKDDNRMYKLSK